MVKLKRLAGDSSGHCLHEYGGLSDVAETNEAGGSGARTGAMPALNAPSSSKIFKDVSDMAQPQALRSHALPPAEGERPPGEARRAPGARLEGPRAAAGRAGEEAAAGAGPGARASGAEAAAWPGRTPSRSPAPAAPARRQPGKGAAGADSPGLPAWPPRRSPPSPRAPRRRAEPRAGARGDPVLRPPRFCSAARPPSCPFPGSSRAPLPGSAERAGGGPEVATLSRCGADSDAPCPPRVRSASQAGVPPLCAPS